MLCVRLSFLYLCIPFVLTVTSGDKVDKNLTSKPKARVARLEPDEGYIHSTPALAMIALDSKNLSSVDIEKGLAVSDKDEGDAETSSDAREPQVTQPGAVAVRGPGADANESNDDDFTVTSPTSQQPEEPVTTTAADVAVEAELVNAEEEGRIMQEKVDTQVMEKLERERAEREMSTPVAEVVRGYWCSPGVRRLVILGVFLATVGIVLGTVLPRVLEPDTPSTPTSASILQDTAALLSNVSFDDGAALSTPSTPQNDALNWLANNTNLANYNDEKKVQRYVLATLYYSTNGDSWWRNTSWLTDKDECVWYNDAQGPFCSSDGAVVELTLFENNLVGTIPEEVALLSDSLGECLFQVVLAQISVSQ